MLALEVLTQRDLDVAASHAIDRVLLDRTARDAGRASLRAYNLRGEVVSLGRYHLAPPGDPSGKVLLHRRLGGGRVLPLGVGFMVLTLTLPHRSALVAADPLTLTPEQVLNRCARALLGGLRTLGVQAFYPGRARITVNGAIVGVISIATEEGGVTAVETVLALDGDWLALAERLAAADASGTLAVELPIADQVTTLAAHGVSQNLETVASCVAESYTQQFGVTLSTAAEPTVPTDTAPASEAWVTSRRLCAGLDHRASEWGHLGVFEVYLNVCDGRIADAVVAGDFIADAPSVIELERRLRGCALARAELTALVNEIYDDPRSYLLGVGAPQDIVDTILRAA